MIAINIQKTRRCSYAHRIKVESYRLWPYVRRHMLFLWLNIKNKLLVKLRIWSLFISLLACAFFISLAIILLLFDLTDYGISFAAIGASIFMIYTQNDHSRKISNKNMFGAYLIAGLSAYICMIFAHDIKVVGALSLLLAIVTMLVLRVVHTPAIGLVLSFVLNKFTLKSIILVLLCIFALIFIAKAIKYVLQNPDRFHIKIYPYKVKFKFHRDKPQTPALVKKVMDLF